MELYMGVLGVFSFVIPFLYTYVMWDSLNIFQCIFGFIIGIPLVYAVGFLLYFVIGYPIRVYNQLVDYEEKIKRLIGDINTSKQKRNDTIRQLVQILTKNISHNSNLIRYVTQARENISRRNYDAALSNVLFVSEAYPYINSVDSFASVNHEISTIESSIKKEREYFNAEVELYNSYVRRFPVNLLVKLPVYEKRNITYFKLDPDASYNPNTEMFS